MSLMASFLCSPFFPRDVLDEIWNLIDAVSEGFATYSFILGTTKHCCSLNSLALGLIMVLCAFV